MKTMLFWKRCNVIAGELEAEEMATPTSLSKPGEPSTRMATYTKVLSMCRNMVFAVAVSSVHALFVLLITRTLYSCYRKSGLRNDSGWFINNRRSRKS